MIFSQLIVETIENISKEEIIMGMNDDLKFGDRIKLKFENGKAWCGTKFDSLKTWMINHPYEAAGLGTTAVIGTREVVRAVRRHEDKVHRERDFYDPRCGRTTRAKRRPSTYELDEIEFRYRNGESYNEILREMNLRQ